MKGTYTLDTDATSASMGEGAGNDAQRNIPVESRILVALWPGVYPVLARAKLPEVLGRPGEYSTSAPVDIHTK